MSRTKGIILAFISSGTFGLIAFFSIPLLKSGMHAPSILFFRSLFSATLLGLVCLLRKKEFRISPKAAIRLFSLGFLYTVTAMGLIYSYNYISSGVATTIHFLYPVVVACMMALFFKEKLSKSVLFAALLSLLGVGLLCWNENGLINPQGFFAALLTVFTYASYIVCLNNNEIKKLSTEVLAFYVMLSGAIIFGTFALFTTGIEVMPDLNAWFNLMGLVLFATVLSGLALILAVKSAGSTITSILGSMEPLVATFVGIIYFRESFGWNSFFGLVIIIFAVILVITSGKKQLIKTVNNTPAQ